MENGLEARGLDLAHLQTQGDAVEDEELVLDPAEPALDPAKPPPAWMRAAKRRFAGILAGLRTHAGTRGPGMPRIGRRRRAG